MGRSFVAWISVAPAIWQASIAPPDNIAVVSRIELGLSVTRKFKSVAASDIEFMVPSTRPFAGGLYPVALLLIAATNPYLAVIE
jgi:hypothetical protein